MKGRIITVAAAFLASAAMLSAQAPPPASAKSGGTQVDEQFVKEAAMGGMAEVELGKLAAQKASSERVKAFGQKMVSDHSAANDELKSIAATKKITLSSDTDAKHKATLTRLQALTGAAFDRAYVADMLQDHEKDVAAFRRESTGGRDAEVKAFAGKTLPTLEEHLKMVRDLRKEIGVSSTGN